MARQATAKTATHTGLRGHLGRGPPVSDVNDSEGSRLLTFGQVGRKNKDRQDMRVSPLESLNKKKALESTALGAAAIRVGS
jgi:hypothetical protein